MENGYRELAVTGAHATAVDLLPAVHKDPFDRMLVTQAQIEGMTLLTSDALVARYPDRSSWSESGAMKKILYVYNERDFHISESAGRRIGEDLAADGRYDLEMTTDLDAFAALPRGDYAAVVVYTTGCRDDLNGAREAGLLQFVQAGGGFVGLHSAADSFRGSREYLEMLGGES